MSFPTELSNAIDGVTEVIAAHLNNLEAKVGIDNSAVPTSLDYLLRNTASIDPGHKHSKLWASGGSPEAVTVDAAGNVGIGTTGPDVALSIYTTSTETSQIKISMSGQLAQFGISSAAPTYGAGIWFAGTQAAHFYGGGLTLGSYVDRTPPSNGLAVSGNVGIGYYDPGTAALVVNGNVGIGTDTPGKKLEVNGYMRGVGIFNTLNSAPPDGDLAAGECAWWFDKTDGAAKFMVKAKQNDGTVKTASISLS